MMMTLNVLNVGAIAMDAELDEVECCDHENELPVISLNGDFSSYEIENGGTPMMAASSCDHSWASTGQNSVVCFGCGGGQFTYTYKCRNCPQEKSVTVSVPCIC
jgi:hypothetical protein